MPGVEIFVVPSPLIFSRMKLFVLHYLQSKKFFNFWLRINHFSQICLNFYRGAAPVNSSGEHNIIKMIIGSCSSLESSTIVDCGANNGLYTDLVLKYSRKLPRVLLFEPTPDLFKLLSVKYSNASNVLLFSVALSNSIGESSFMVNNSRGQLNSLLDSSCSVYSKPEAGNVVSSIMVQTTILDRVCADLAIGSILLLKIDVEGAECLVLEGANSMILSRKIRYIQLEYSKHSLSLLSFQLLYEKYSEIYRFSLLCSDGLAPISGYSDSFESLQCAIFLMELKS